MTAAEITKLNIELRSKSPLEIVRWAIAQSKGHALVSTNFRPYEAAILHLAVQAQPDIPVLWVDHGYNRDQPKALEYRAGLGLRDAELLPRKVGSSSRPARVLWIGRWPSGRFPREISSAAR